jgi:hypothetical protein
MFSRFLTILINAFKMQTHTPWADFINTFSAMSTRCFDHVIELIAGFVAEIAIFSETHSHKM